MIIYSYPKINIGLYITEKRSDGFHNLETIFYQIDNQFDTISISKIDKGIKFNTEGPVQLLNSDENLCVKAVHLLQKYYTSIDGIQIDLFKTVPIGSGLGGGSSNAAAILNGLNEIFKLNITKEELKKIALELGSDVPFFIEGKTSYAEGRGELLEPLDFVLTSKVISVITPPVKISTKEIFQLITPQRKHICLKEAIQKPVREWKNIIFNDFEEIVFTKFPGIRTLKNKMYELGADYVSLSGSGSSLYAIGDKRIEIISNE